MFGKKNKMKKGDYHCQFCGKKVAVGKKIMANKSLHEKGFKWKGHRVCLEMAVKTIKEATNWNQIKHLKII